VSHGVSIANLPLELKWKPWLISSFMKPIYVFLIYLITLFKKRKDLFEKLWHRRVTDYDLGLDWNRQKGGNRNVGDYFEKAMVWLAVLYSMVLIVSWLFQPNMPFKATGRLPIYMNANNWVLCDLVKLKIAFILFAVCTFIQYIQRKSFENLD